MAYSHAIMDLLKQDYIDSMEGATLSGRQTSARINEAGSFLYDLRQRQSQTEVNAPLEATDEPTFVLDFRG